MVAAALAQPDERDQLGPAKLITASGQAKLATQEEQLDPRKDGWSTEVLSEGAARQLDALAKWLSSAGDVEAEALKGVAAKSFTCGSLRPAKLGEAFRTGSWRCFVQRTTPSPTPIRIAGSPGWPRRSTRCSSRFTVRPTYM